MAGYRALLLMIMVLVLVSLACNAFAGNVEPALPPPPTLDGGTAVPGQADEAATPGVAATVTLPVTGEATATLDFPVVQALVDLNVRTGPGIIYDAVGFLLQDEMARVLGKDPASGWWLIECPPRATGTTCWVTGRVEFTAITLPEAVPVAEVPPTPTPEPRAIGPIVAYVDNGRLFVLPLDINQTPVTAAAPVLLAEETNILDLHISPNGRHIAYRVQTDLSNELHIANVDGSGSQVLLAAADLPTAGEQTASTSVVWINQVGWLPDSQTLLFNTEVRNRPGSGTNQEDLWQVSLSGEPEQLFSPGAGAGLFTISNTGQVLMSRSNAILRRSGSTSEPLIQFTPVSAPSGSRHYPQPQWSDDGTRALVAVPASDPRATNARVELWQIPSSGTAILLGNLDGYSFSDPILWSPDGNRMGYVRQVGGETPLLLLAGTGGQDLSTVHSEPNLTFWGWAPDSNNFLYGGPGFWAIGRPGQNPAANALPAGAQVGDAQWLTADSFLLAVGNSGAWTLTSGVTDGRQQPLSPLGDRLPLFSVWVP